MPRKPSMTCVHPAAIVRMLVGATDCVADAAGPRLVEYTNTTTSAQSANVQIEEDVSAIQIHGRAIAAATAGTPRNHRTSLTCSLCVLKHIVSTPTAPKPRVYIHITVPIIPKPNPKHPSTHCDNHKTN